MTAFIFIAFCALLNRARGSKLFELSSSTNVTRIVCAALLGSVYGALSGSLANVFIVAAGYMFWAIPGWGKYFSALHGQDDRSESEIKWIDWVGYRLVRSNNKLRGVLCMGLRGLYMYPLFLALGAPIIGFAVLLQGVPYCIAGINKLWSIREAEYMWGAIMGLMLWGAI